VLDLALPARPLAAAQLKLDADHVALFEAIEILAALARELKQHELRVAVAELEHELALAEAVRDLLGFENLEELALGLQIHGRGVDEFGGEFNCRSDPRGVAEN